MSSVEIKVKTVKTVKAETEMTDTGMTDTGMTDTGMTDTGMTDTGMTDTGMTDTGMTDTGMTDTGMTDTGMTESAEVHSARGLFIVLEGIDGAGTTTQAHRLINWLHDQGRTAHFTCEPSEGVIGSLTRSALRGERLGRDQRLLPPECLALLFAADRADHWYNEVEPRLARGVDVICDRYLYSSLAYQGLELDEAWVRQLNAPFPAPDLLLFVEVTPEVAAARREQRQLAPDRYEVDALQREIAKRYARICRDASAYVIRGDLEMEAVTMRCIETLNLTLKAHLQRSQVEKRSGDTSERGAENNLEEGK